MDHWMIGSVVFLVVWFCFVIFRKLSNADKKPSYLPKNNGDIDSIQPQQSYAISLPWFDPEPRKETILAAGRYHWKMSIVYYSTDGRVRNVICSAPQTAGVQRRKITSISLTTSDGEDVPLHRIRSIEVQAASEDTRRRYRVRDEVSGAVLNAWREAIEATIKVNGNVTITYQDEQGNVSVRTIQPTKLLSANSRPKVRAHCHLADAERHFLIERMLELQVMPSIPAAEGAGQSEQSEASPSHDLSTIAAHSGEDDESHQKATVPIDT